MSYKAQTSVGLVSTFEHTSWSWYWVLLKSFSYCWYWVGPRLIFGWHEAGISLVLTCKRPIGTRLVFPQVPTRLVLVSGWYLLMLYQSGRVLATSVGTWYHCWYQVLAYMPDQHWCKPWKIARWATNVAFNWRFTVAYLIPTRIYKQSLQSIM
jgi:hypothetical protein